ncbi:MAG TPA: LysM peptidoglycan-binding domain-containing protein [Candidatus Acidoferrum sp.]|nr:LysM peptidoglycan-binding domain-containing protein [Candidatus Acidoferrum sp.]
MANFGPIIPPDSPLALPDKNRLRKRIVIFGSFAATTLGIMAVALQGCNGPAGKAVEQAGVTNPLPVFDSPANAPAVIEANVTPAPPSATARSNPSRPMFTGSRPYKIAKGDNFDTLAKKFHIPVKALEDANPGLEPKKLQIDQVIQIPIVSAPAAGSVSQSGAVTSR